MIESLQQTIEKIAEQPKTVNNNSLSSDYSTIFIDEIDDQTEFEEKSNVNIEECIVSEDKPLILGEYTIEHRSIDGYINVTNLCKAGKKEYSKWFRLDKTKAFLQALSMSIHIIPDTLIKYEIVSKTERSTWAHPQVAINIAQWISPSFDVKVSAWVYEIMITGKLDIKNTKSYLELQSENKDKELKINYLTKKYVKKQSRKIYEERNVIYILTTNNLKKERRYIVGKAEILENRLSTYNKSDEHEVIYYQSCKTIENMALVEGLVLNTFGIKYI
jgi:hypothetical protein